mmetsp:Transcript_17710/g.41332  ORF Transcript_17710/g.41332 Transcript_17710/m.41332 type:complete len:211 (-) Transcript_17710:400-1032(-)
MPSPSTPGTRRSPWTLALHLSGSKSAKPLYVRSLTWTEYAPAVRGSKSYLHAHLGSPLPNSCGRAVPANISADASPDPEGPEAAPDASAAGEARTHMVSGGCVAGPPSPGPHLVRFPTTSTTYTDTRPPSPSGRGAASLPLPPTTTTARTMPSLSSTQPSPRARKSGRASASSYRRSIEASPASVSSRSESAPDRTRPSSGPVDRTPREE